MDMLHLARGVGLRPDAARVADPAELWSTSSRSHWHEPDEGIWEMRGPRRHFTHSKVMAWVAVDRAVKAVERFGLKGPVDQWRRLRDDIHAQVCTTGYDARARLVRAVLRLAADLDASLLLMPLVGFLPPDDPRVLGDDRGDPARAGRRRPRDSLPDRATASTACRPAKAPSCPARSGSPTVSRSSGRIAEADERCSSGCSERATTSACSPRSTTRARAACWATFRRR